MLFPTEQVLSYNSSGNNCVTLNGFILLISHYGNNKKYMYIKTWVDCSKTFINSVDNYK